MAPAESALGVPPENAPSSAPSSAPAQPEPMVAPAPTPVVEQPPKVEPARAELAATEDTRAMHAYFAQQLQLSDGWVEFEAKRDERTRAAERVFFPMALGIEGALAAAYAAGASDVTDSSRIIAGVTAGVTVAAMVPTILAKSRSGKRAWFAAGAAVFSLGAGATLIAAPQDSSDKSARWAGASLAVQGLMMLPVGFIQGFPEESEYEAYRKLPDSERPAAAAKLLARVDRFEQRAAAIALWSTLASAVVLGVGAAVTEDGDQARVLGGLTLVPVVSALALFAPRLLVRNRLDRFAFGEAPRRLPLNGW
ncbi:MAG: hypothetical protein ABW352_07550 [Polyangiales bacterium]